MGQSPSRFPPQMLDPTNPAAHPPGHWTVARSFLLTGDQRGPGQTEVALVQGSSLLLKGASAPKPLAPRERRVLPPACFSRA